MNASLSTTTKTDELAASVTEVYTYLTANVEPRLVSFGSSVPAAERQNLPWVKTLGDTNRLDGVFTYHNDNWYTPVATPIGTTSLFTADTDLPLGWINPDDISDPASYTYYTFTGANLLVVEGVAYRRHDQPLGA